MTQQRRLALVGAAATLLASTALASVYQGSGFVFFILDSPNWFLYVAAGIASVTAAAIGVRALRAPVWVQPLAGLGGLLLYVTVVFGEGALVGIIPTPATFASLDRQITFAFGEIASMSAPVPVHRGLLLLAVLGVGLIAVIVDTFAVTLERASLAGLPLLVLYAVPVSIDRDGLSWWMFAFGAAGYLWLLVTDQLDRVNRWGRPFRQTPKDAFGATSLGSTGRWVGAFGIVLAAIIPLLVPGISTAGWFDGLGSGDGRSVETINPITQLKGQLTQKDDIELLRLETNDKNPFYLRVTTLDQYGASGWTQRTLSATPEERVSRGISDYNGISDAMIRVRQQSTIRIRAFSRSSYLPLFANPQTVKVKGDWRWDDRADTAFSTKARTGDLTYQFNSERIEFDAKQLLAAPHLDLTSSQVKEYTGTSGRVVPEVRSIVDGLVRAKRTQYEQVVAINDYFSIDNGFRYSTSTTPGTTGSDLLDFLSNKQGYCEQYASAMAYMVRAANIPARVAIGFGYGRKTGKYTSVTNHDAHAWVEVYFSGAGWVPFDPTPPGGPGRTGNLAWTKPPAESAPGGTPSAAPTDPNAGQPGGQAPNDPSRDKDLGQGVPTTSQAGDEKFAMPVWSAPLFGLATPLLDGQAVPQLPVAVWWLIVLVLLLALAGVPALWRLETRRIRLGHVRSVNPFVSAHSAWDEVTDTLVDVGLGVSDAETPRAVASQLARIGISAQAQAAAWRLASAEEEVLYAPRAVLAGHPADRSAAVAATRLVCEEILAHSAKRVRIRARFLPPSFLVRVSGTITEIGETLSIGISDTRTAVAKLVPRRT
jgi:transglutaminase-like putative cysteine protease